jgi:Fur family ferric uptake transcriptional regulator
MSAGADSDSGAVLERAGLRATPRRRQVFEELARESGAVTAQALWSRLRARECSSVGLATVYRTLALLHDCGVIDVLPEQGGELRYRVCGEAHHHHLVCSRCDRVVEVDLGGLGDRLGEVAAGHGFLATDHRIEIVGLCPDCRREES